MNESKQLLVMTMILHSKPPTCKVQVQKERPKRLLLIRTNQKSNITYPLLCTDSLMAACFTYTTPMRKTWYISRVSHHLSLPFVNTTHLLNNKLTPSQPPKSNNLKDGPPHKQHTQPPTNLHPQHLAHRNRPLQHPNNLPPLPQHPHSPLHGLRNQRPLPAPPHRRRRKGRSK